jgi:general secretion pathway protein E
VEVSIPQPDADALSISESTVAVSHGPAFLCGRPLGEILTHTAKLAPEKLDQALTEQKEKGGRLGEILVAMKALNEAQVLEALAIQLDLPFMEEIDSGRVSDELVQKVPINFAKQYRIVPLRMAGDAVDVAVADPLETAAIDQVRILLGAAVNPYVAPSQQIIDTINLIFDRAHSGSQQLVEDLEAAEDLETLTHELDEPAKDLIDADDEAPIIRLVNSLMHQAVKERASDIHIEPFEKEVVVRFRVDGVLKEVVKPPKRSQKAIASRVKIMGALNIAETRLPQDGRIRIKIAGKDIDIRLSTIPTAHGEGIVMRLLDKTQVLLDLPQLGMSEEQLVVMSSLISKSHGIVLVTGPTGSGKTTTLYACLDRINKPDLKILTIEDPVEYQLRGISQTAVNPKIGLSFASGLRAFLRQDPDVIMVGEIRDLETAEIAIQASLTGHLVFSTVHTNDAPGAITRLVDMGVEPFLVNSSLVGVVAQRLVRVLCKECRQPYRPEDEELREIGIDREFLEAQGSDVIYKPVGCKECNRTGYRGRSGIYEMLIVGDAVRSLILKNVDSNTIKKAGVEQGMHTLIMDGAYKVAKGFTSIAEVLSVTQEDVI